jgi:Domain of unknown function (DUF5615)
LGTLSSELTPHAGRLASEPRIYADANIPNGVVAYMRDKLRWDVLFVLEHEDLRRARDIEHYRLARQLRRTLLTLDHDYLDDRRFPPAEGPGVIVFSVPDERWLRRLLADADQQVFRAEGAAPLPLEGRKREWHVGETDVSRRAAGDATPDPSRRSAGGATPDPSRRSAGGAKAEGG